MNADPNGVLVKLTRNRSGRRFRGVCFEDEASSFTGHWGNVGLGISVNDPRVAGWKHSVRVVEIPAHRDYDYGWKDVAKQEIKFFETNGGWMHISMPNAKLISGSGKAISVARKCYEYLHHEWHHILEYQGGGRSNFEFSEGLRRRPNWVDRPEEQRAISAAHLVNEDPTEEDDALVFELAEFMEGSDE